MIFRTSCFISANGSCWETAFYQLMAVSGMLDIESLLLVLVISFCEHLSYDRAFCLHFNVNFLLPYIDLVSAAVAWASFDCVQCIHNVFRPCGHWEFVLLLLMLCSMVSVCLYILLTAMSPTATDIWDIDSVGPWNHYYLGAQFPSRGRAMLGDISGPL